MTISWNFQIYPELINIFFLISSGRNIFFYKFWEMIGIKLTDIALVVIGFGFTDSDLDLRGLMNPNPNPNPINILNP